jgi:endonuclease YncB( thermonuclease family)
MPWTPLNQHSSARTAGAKTTGAALWQARALAEFLEASSPTHCQFVTRDRYGRFVGNCFRADDKSIAVYLVRNGLALDWPQYSKGQYAQEQAGGEVGETRALGG